MKPILTVIATVFVLGLLGSQANAQPYDHFQCYKVKDPAKFKVDVDLQRLQVQQLGGPERCQVKGKAKLFCAPTNKTPDAATFQDSSVPPLVPNGHVGPDQEQDLLCYKIKCPDNEVPDSLDVNDQFGERTLRKFKTSMLCTPAVKVFDSGTTTTTSTTTTTVPPPAPCDLVAQNQCGGSCPNSNEVCVLNGTAQGPPCICIPITPTPCFDAAAPVCNGYCPNGQICREVINGQCDCKPLIEKVVPLRLELVIPDPPGGGGSVSVQLDGPGGVRMENSPGTFETEIISMDLRGSTPFGVINLRSSNGLPLPGTTMLSDGGGGTCTIDSFFDVFFDLTVDIGGPTGQCQQMQQDAPLRVSGVSPQPTADACGVDSFFDVWTEVSLQAPSQCVQFVDLLGTPTFQACDMQLSFP